MSIIKRIVGFIVMNGGILFLVVRPRCGRKPCAIDYHSDEFVTLVKMVSALVVIALLSVGCATTRPSIFVDEKNLDIITGSWAGEWLELGWSGPWHSRRQDSEYRLKTTVKLEIEGSPLRGKFSLSSGRSWVTDVTLGTSVGGYSHRGEIRLGGLLLPEMYHHFVLNRLGDKLVLTTYMVGLNKKWEKIYESIVLWKQSESKTIPPSLNITGWNCKGNWSTYEDTYKSGWLVFSKLSQTGANLDGTVEFKSGLYDVGKYDDKYDVRGTVSSNRLEVQGPYGWMRLAVEGGDMIGFVYDRTFGSPASVSLKCKR